MVASAPKKAGVSSRAVSDQQNGEGRRPWRLGGVQNHWLAAALADPLSQAINLHNLDSSPPSGIPILKNKVSENFRGKFLDRSSIAIVLEIYQLHLVVRPIGA